MIHHSHRHRIPEPKPPTNPWHIIGWLILIGFGVFVGLILLLVVGIMAMR